MRPASTDIPGTTLTSFTRPARGALSSFSIFIASTTITPWRAATSSPGSTSTRTTRPGMGAAMLTWPWPCAPASACALRRPLRVTLIGTSLEADQHLARTWPWRELEVGRLADAGHCPLFATTAVTRSGFLRQQQEAELVGPDHFDDPRHPGHADPEARSVHPLDRDRKRPAGDLDLEGHGRKPSRRASCVHPLRAAPAWPSRPALARR